MRKLIILLTVFVLLAGLTACQKSATSDKNITVGVSFFPMKDILVLIENDLKR